MSDKVKTGTTFAVHHIKAIAEFTWWRYAQKGRLIEAFNLTEKQFKEIQSTPEYKEYVFNLMFENRSAEEFEAWVESYHDMPQRFGRTVGLASEDVPDMVEQVRQAHADIAAGKGRKPWRLQT
ncbi:MAG: hypothetical protein OXU51_14605 [Candidatus Poribacteria bacterium]|nr:hypothetical protein [Candidatus Poribacteria bacterium]